jgi:hydroxymethylbilane synthase
VKQVLRIATRKSPLALWQANFIADELQRHWPELRIKLIPRVTSGDRFLKEKLLAQGGKGLFVKELEEALLANQADIAVHSMKDVPTQLPPGLVIQTIYKRDNPFDALISKHNLTLNQLPPGAIIGTSSLRRQAQLLAYRDDLRIEFMRGNIHTRLEKLTEGPFDAIVLAASAIERMDLQALAAEQLAPPVMFPACAQGALGIECREADEKTCALLAPLHDLTTGLCVQAERRVNALLGGNCHVPLAVYCHADSGQQVTLHTHVMSPDGKMRLSEQRAGPITTAELLATESVTALIAKGAEQLLLMPR